MEDLKQIQEFFSKPLEEKMVTPKRGHNYYQLYRDTPIKYISGRSGMGLEVPGVLLHNEYDTINGQEGAYIIDYFGQHFYVDMENKFASKIANPRDPEQNEDLIKNMGRTALAPEFSNWKKYLNVPLEEAKVDEAYIVTYAKNKGEKPASAAYKLRGSALAFMRDLEKDGYITMLTQKPVDGVDESLTENEDPIIVKYFKRGDKYFQILVKYEKPVGFTTALGSRTALGQQNDQNEAAAQKRVKTIVNNLKANFDLDDIFVEEGQVAGRYYINAFSDDFIDMDVNDLEGFFTLEESLDEADLNDPVAMKMRAAKMKADKLAKMRAANAGDDGNDKFFDAAKLRALKKKRAQIMRDMEQEAEMEGGEVANRYGDMLNKIDKAIAMLSEYNTGLYYDPAKERNAIKAKQASKSGLEKVRDFIKKVMKEEEITVDDATEFKINLKHLLDKHVVKGEALSDSEEKEANYDELYKDYKYKVDEAKPKKGHGEKISKEVFAKLKGKTINYKGADYKVIDSDEAVLKIKHLEDGDVTTINLRQFNVSGMIEEILETIELGRQLDEKKLCKKGRAYRKRRMAAGEKSSAYLSGRAVKVCKGQISGRSKRKKRRRKK